jgi:heterodisulfide reductase subunit B
MKYTYYPGCSLEGTAREYDLSTRAVLAALGVELVELSDWTCCGATAAEGISSLLALSLAARNLALAESRDHPLDILVPCSACYLNLKNAEIKAHEDPQVRNRVNEVLAVEGRTWQGRTRVKHLLEVLSRDLGAESVRKLVKTKLTGRRLAPYYGCQCLRPHAVFDDPEQPTSMEPLLGALGAEIHDWGMGGRCCGASHMTTKPEVALTLVDAILSQAVGADAIVTVCPMCQMNLEAYQDKISRKAGTDLRITVIYLPQLIGLALGLTEAQLRLKLNLAVHGSFLDNIQASPS